MTEWVALMLRVLLVLMVGCMATARAQPPPESPPVTENQRFQLGAECQPVGLIVGAQPGAGKIGLTEESLQNAAESRLRAARVYGSLSSGGQTLAITVNVVGPAYSINVQFYRPVVAVREVELFSARMIAAVLKKLRRSPQKDPTLVLRSADFAAVVAAIAPTLPIRPAITWERGSTGTHGGQRDAILGALSEHLDQFLVEYLRANEAACSGGASIP